MAERKTKKVVSEEDSQSIENKLDEISAKTKQSLPSPEPATKRAKSDKEPIDKKTSRKKTDRLKKVRGRKYLAVREKVDQNKAYSLAEAIKHIKVCSYAKFDETVELHIKMQNPKKKKDDVAVFRGMVRLPSGSPKKRKIAVATEELVEEIKKGKINFDVLLATPEMMPKLAVVAKILGPKGKMPSPKGGTVTNDPAKTQAELSGGLAEYKTDARGIIHLAVGKLSWPDDRLEANIAALLALLPRRDIGNIALASTMSPGIKVAPDS